MYLMPGIFPMPGRLGRQTRKSIMIIPPTASIAELAAIAQAHNCTVAQAEAQNAIADLRMRRAGYAANATAARKAAAAARRTLKAAAQVEAQRADLQGSYDRACAQVRAALSEYSAAVAAGVSKWGERGLRRVVICAHARAERARRKLESAG